MSPLQKFPVAKAALLALVVTLSGCGNDDPTTIAEKATRELGVPVSLWAYNDDKCAVDQLKKFFDEYKKMKKSQRNAFKAALQAKYRSLIFNMTIDAGRVTGGTVELQLVQRNCDSRNRCTDNVVNTKTFNERSSTMGDLPGTKIEKERDLTLTPVKAKDETGSVRYSTRNEAFFRFFTQDQAFNMAGPVSAGTVTVVSSSRADGKVTCGPTASLANVL